MQHHAYRLLAGCALLLLGACGTSPNSTFYSLKPLAASESNTATQKKEIAVRINRFVFPDYIDRPNIVTRPAGNRIDIAEFQRWAGSLSSEFHRILGANLGVLLNTPRISAYPSDIAIDAQFYISGNVVAFDGTLGRDVLLDVYWFVNDRSRRQLLAVRHTEIVVDVKGKDYEALVSAYGQALLQLSTQMQATIEELAKKSP